MAGMYFRVRTGGQNEGMVLSVHRTHAAANAKSGTKVYEAILPGKPGEKLRAGDFVPDWRDRWHEYMNFIRTNHTNFKSQYRHGFGNT